MDHRQKHLPIQPIRPPTVLFILFVLILVVPCKLNPQLCLNVQGVPFLR
jgi:hypothetical protein